VFATIESAMQIQSHVETFAIAAPTFVTVPFTILTQGVVDASRESAARPIALLFTGRPHSSFDHSRSAVYRQLRAAGAACTPGMDERVTCVLCSAAEGGRRGGACAAKILRALALQPHEDPSVFGARKVLALASRATLCLEPTSDTLVRSHAYGAALVGCVPVLFDPATPMPRPFRSDPRPYPTDWAWRHLPRGLSALAGGEGAARRTNYSNFAVIEHAAALVARRREGLVDELVALASVESEQHRLRTMQSALARAAPLLHHTPRPTPCSEPPCDAFQMFELIVRALVHS
jgi:hypothetical protein